MIQNVAVAIFIAYDPVTAISYGLELLGIFRIKADENGTIVFNNTLDDGFVYLD